MASRRFVNKSKKNYSLDLTPLIDVVFLLLIFFMVATNFSKFSSLDIKVPKSSVENISTLIESIEVLVDSEKKFLIRTTINDKVELNETKKESLLKEINFVLANSQTKNIVLIADEILDYGYIVNIMSLLKEAGAEGISLKTEN